MRWPFGPPHLTLKPSKKTKHKKTKKTKQKTTQKNQKKQNKQRKSKKHKNTKKRAFQSSVKIFFFWHGIQKLPFLTPWPRKRAPQKHYKNRGFSLFLLERSYASRNGHFWTKKTQIQKFQLSFFLAFFLFQKQKTQKSVETPIFIVF